jgi:ankyrin repeat protein
MNGHVDVVSALLGAEANIEVPDNAGHTPLHIAAINGRIGIVRELLRTVAGRPAANIEARDNVGHTPLHYAAAGGHVELVRLLLENGANKEEPCSLIDFYNFGPLRCRAFKGRKVKCEHS